MRSSALIFSDSHLDRRVWAKRSALVDDSKFAFQSIVDKALEHSVPCVICAGDFFNSKTPHTAVVQFVRCQIERLSKARIPFFFIQGQHDMQAPTWMSALHDWPTHIHQKLIKLPTDERYIYGIDWQPTDKVPEAFDQFEKDTKDLHGSKLILVMHQVWDEFMRILTNTECSWSQIPKVETLITGDYHTYIKTSSDKYTTAGRDGQQINVLSPGSTHMRDIQEQHKKYCFLLLPEAGFHLEKLELLTRPTTRLDIETEDKVKPGLKKILSWVSEQKALPTYKELPIALQCPHVVIRLNSDLSHHKELLMEKISPQAFLHIQQFKDGGVDKIHISPEERRKIAAKGMVGSLEHYIEDNEKLKRIATRLLSAENIKKEIDSVCHEYGVKTTQNRA